MITVFGILPEGRPQLCWSNGIINDLIDLNIRKELAEDGQNGKEQLCQEKCICKECKPSEVEKHYKQWIR